jgi:hypothetical protein
LRSWVFAFVVYLSVRVPRSPSASTDSKQNQHEQVGQPYIFWACSYVHMGMHG